MPRLWLTDEDTATELRVAWRKSPERKRVQSAALVLIGLWTLGVLLAAILGAVTAPSYDRATHAVSAAFFTGTIGSGFAYLVHWGFRRSQHQAWEDSVEIDYARESLHRAESDIASGSEIDFASLWAVTQKRLDYYHQIATNQAKRSFRNAQLAAVVGFVIVAISSFAALFARSGAGAVAAAVLGAAGGGFAGYIGRTFLVSQETATLQLREYFAQPLEFSKYLAAERLLAPLDAEKRAETTAALIRGIIGTRADSQRTSEVRSDRVQES